MRARLTLSGRGSFARIPERAAPLLLALLVLLAAAAADAQKVYLNPSNQTGNPVSGGGNEGQYALICANLAKAILVKAGFDVVVDQDFTSAPSNANSWGAEIFVSMHTNAGGGHGTETLYKTDGGKALAAKVQEGLLASLGYQSRGLKLRTDLHVLNSTNMYACLDEAVFHDCTAQSGYQGHPPSESSFLRTAAGQQKIAEGVANGICAYFGKSCAAAPETGRLGWTVYRAPNLDDKLEGATVAVAGGPSMTTGADGAYSFDLAPGAYTVSASKTGFLSATASATVVAGQEALASLGLRPVEAPDAGLDGAPGVDLPGPSGDGGDPPRISSGCCRVDGGASADPVGLLALVVVGLLWARARRR